MADEKKQKENKTQPTRASVKRYLDAIENAGRREDAKVLVKLMQTASGEKPRMWGESIVGFGEYQYTYESGHSGRSMLVGFAPRKANMVVYIMPGFSKYQKLLDKLGKHKHSKSCLYLGRLSNVDLKVLQTLITRSVKEMRKKYKVS